MRSEPATLAKLMAKADEYDMANSTMRVKTRLNLAGKAVQSLPANPRPTGDNKKQQQQEKQVGSYFHILKSRG